MAAGPMVCRVKCKHPLHRKGAVLGHGELWFKDHCSSLTKNRVEASGGKKGEYGGTDFTPRVLGQSAPPHLSCQENDTSLG